MKLSHSILIGMCSALIAVALLRASNFAGSTELQLVSQPAFDRVMRTHTLRCAYSSVKPYFVTLDTDTNMRRGLAHDIVEQMGRILGLQIVWAEEVAPSQVDDNLLAGREDAMCFPLWPSGPMAASLDYTLPVDYMPVYAYARADDTRFDGDLSKLNDKNLTIPVIANGAAKDIAEQDFPLAAQYSVTGQPDEAHMMLTVTQKRADAGFTDPFSGADFMKNNPGTLKYVQNVAPVRVFPESFAVAKGETKLRDMLNIAINQLQESGFIAATLDKYLGEHKGQYFYVTGHWHQ